MLKLCGGICCTLKRAGFATDAQYAHPATLSAGLSVMRWHRPVSSRRGRR
jgi:hypothetical protein